MKKQIVSIFVGMLLFVTVSSVTGTVNIGNNNYHIEPQPVTTEVVWSENFDNYTLGSSMHGQGGWKGWDNDPQWTAYVSANHSRSSPHSVDIKYPADLVHEFSGISSGQWTFIDWVYVPSDFSGENYFILLGDYEDGAGQDNKWAVQLRMDSALGVIESEYDALNLPLIYDQWVEIRVEFDLETDWFECYYDDEILVEKNWSAGPNNAGDCPLQLEAVDLFCKSGTSVFHDDLSLEGEPSVDPDLSCEGTLQWDNVSKGSEQTGTFTVENIGGGSSLLDWDIVKKPSWGEWTFNPNGGDDLEPGNPVTVQVTVTAPNEKNENFAGQIKIQNADNPDDSCTIDVKLSTPMSKPYGVLNFFEKLFQRFPALEQILSHILG